MNHAASAGQTLVNAGGTVAYFGGRMGLALGRQALNNPMLVSGLASMAVGTHSAYDAVQSGNRRSPGEIAIAMTIAGAGMVLAHVGTRIHDRLNAIENTSDIDAERLPVSPETVGKALNMLMGFDDDADMIPETHPHTQNVIDHLSDIVNQPAARLHRTVRHAAETANDDPKQLIRNLTAAMTTDPSVLPQRMQLQRQA